MLPRCADSSIKNRIIDSPVVVAAAVAAAAAAVRVDVVMSYLVGVFIPRGS